MATGQAYSGMGHLDRHRALFSGSSTCTLGDETHCPDTLGLKDEV